MVEGLVLWPEVVLQKKKYLTQMRGQDLKSSKDPVSGIGHRGLRITLFCHLSSVVWLLDPAEEMSAEEGEDQMTEDRGQSLRE